MKRVRMIGSVLVFVFALGAVAASVAAAALPEFVSEGGKFPVPFTVTSGTGVLETVGGRKVVCKTGRGTGEITGEKSTAKDIALFDGCTASGPFGISLPCTSAGQPEGSIETNPSKSTLVYDTTAAQKAKKEKGKVALVRETEKAGELGAEFKCESGLISVTIKVRGSGIGLILPSAVNAGFIRLIPLSATLTPPGKPTDKEYEKPGGELSTVKGEVKSEGAESFGYEEAGALGQGDILSETNIEVKA